MKCHIRPIRFAKISNSNRYSRFDSYSIRTQTADSQVPTITTCRYEHPCPCNCLHVTARQSRPLWRCAFSLPPHCSDSHNARTHFLKCFASAEIVPFEWAGQQTGTPLTILPPPKKSFWGLQNHLRKNIEFLWVYAYAGKIIHVHYFNNKKLSYRRGTARCVVSVEILPISTQQCRNYLYDKSWTKYQLSLIDPCDKIVL